MNSFEVMCNDAVKRFIKTVAIIDDEATYDLNTSSQNYKNLREPLQTPLIGIMMGKQSAESPAHSIDKIEESNQEEDDTLSQLDAKTLINAFADIGIACCIQRPEKEDQPLDRAVKLAASVDVVVIDWVLKKNNISLSREIIKKILEDDKKTGHRMRLIVIYTSHNYITNMLEDIKKDADELYADDPLMEKRKPNIINTWLLMNDWLRIVILNKEKTNNPLAEARIVSFDKLPEIIISEFSEMMKGIIPGATLHGIAAIREKTHKLLSVLNNNLDGAYCFHRTLIHEPSDSVDFAMNLITNEIDTIIQTDVSARQIVNEKGLKAWLKQHAGNRSKLPCYGSSFSIETVEKCVLNGNISENKCTQNIKSEFRSNWVQLKDEMDNPLPRPSLSDIMHFMEVFYSDPDDAINGCKELSNLQCTAMDIGRRLYDGKLQNPTLHLGTILKKRNRGHVEWFLCLTPLCDCVRLEGESNFLFLQLYPGTDNKTDIIIKTQDGTFEHLIFKQKKLRILTIPFKPINDDKRINARLWRKEWRVKSNNNSYQWVGELRYPKALAIAHHVAANASRVGIDEFEWLRLQATLK